MPRNTTPGDTFLVAVATSCMDGLCSMACGQLDSTGGAFKHSRLGPGGGERRFGSRGKNGTNRGFGVETNCFFRKLVLMH